MKTLSSTIKFLLLYLVMSSCQASPPTNHYTIVYSHNKAGEAVQGSKKALIQAIRSGADIKVGWGSKGKTRSIEHISVPIWLGIMNEEEVVAYLDPQVFAQADWEQLTATYADTTLAQTEWRVVLTTKGEFDAIWYDRVQGEQTRRVPQQHPMTWFAKGGASISDPFFE